MRVKSAALRTTTFEQFISVSVINEDAGKRKRS